MSNSELMVQGLQLLAAQAASKIATRGPISDGIHRGENLGVAPGRLVYDPVSGQTVTVIGATVAYLPQATIEEATRGG